MKAVGWIVAAIFIAGVLVAACFATIHDGDNRSLGRLELVSHRHRDRCDYDDCDRRDDRDGGKQTCFMACYITVPGLPGGDRPQEPQSLFPPTPDKIIGGIQVMGDAGIKLGSTIAQLVIDYVVTVFRFIV